MANDLFGKLGNFGNLGGAIGDLVSGLSKSGLVPQDDPDVKTLNAQREIADLQKREADIFTEIGRQAFNIDPSACTRGDELRQIQAEIAAAQSRLTSLEEEREKARQEQEAADADARCPSCGRQNAEGVKFCQECGAKLGKTPCVSCGAELAPGARFCGVCGARQPE